MNPKVKNIIIFSVLGLALVLVYIFFIKKTPEDTASIVSTSPAAEESVLPVSTEPTGVGEGFLSLLLSVKSIKLDDTIFSGPAFASLKDSSIVLVQEGNEGRPNPFAPIGYEASFLSAAPTVAAPTIPPTTPAPTNPAENNVSPN
jgi:hypothetical protein